MHRLVAVVGMFSALSVSALHAQPVESNFDTGTWMGAGIGAGWTRISCTICRRDRDLGPTAYLRFGTTLRPGLLVGGEVNGWTHTNEDDVRATAASLAGVAYVYPNPSGGVFFKGGLGWVRYGADQAENDNDVSTNLLGLLVGLGYEFRVGPGLTVTNYVNLLASSFGSLRSERANVTDDVSLSLLQIGIGLTRH